VLTVLELAHGITRADTTERRQRRQRFLDDLLTGVPIQPITVPIALRAGQIDGQSQTKGVRIPLSDLLIGASALELGYSVGTANIRHFQLIPGLNVIAL
jgi:predicted nucleic acid-binding protein